MYDLLYAVAATILLLTSSSFEIDPNEGLEGALLPLPLYLDMCLNISSSDMYLSIPRVDRSENREKEETCCKHKKSASPAGE